jgi:hypothetical protein
MKTIAYSLLSFLFFFSSTAPSRASTYLKCTRPESSPGSYYTVTVDTSSKRVDMTSVDSSMTRYDNGKNVVFSPDVISWVTTPNSLFRFFWYLDRSTLKMKMATELSDGRVSVGGSSNIKAIFACSKVKPAAVNQI